MTDRTKRSRTSGVTTAAEKSTWRRRPGTPGGGRSEAQKLGIAVPKAPSAKIDDHAIRAFLLGDARALGGTFGFTPWDPTPLVPWELHPSSACRTPVARRARAIRRQIIAALEARGGFTYADLEGRADEDRSRRAWWRLGSVAGAVGIDQAQWDATLIKAGWTPAGPEETDPNVEAETARLAAELFPGEIERRVYPARGGAE